MTDVTKSLYAQVDATTWRMVVPGGWIYRSVIAVGKEGEAKPEVTMCFVPLPPGGWIYRSVIAVGKEGEAKPEVTMCFVPWLDNAKQHVLEQFGMLGRLVLALSEAAQRESPLDELVALHAITQWIGRRSDELASKVDKPRVPPSSG